MYPIGVGDQFVTVVALMYGQLLKYAPYTIKVKLIKNAKLSCHFALLAPQVPNRCPTHQVVIITMPTTSDLRLLCFHHRSILLCPWVTSQYPKQLYGRNRTQTYVYSKCVTTPSEQYNKAVEYIRGNKSHPRHINYLIHCNDHPSLCCAVWNTCPDGFFFFFLFFFFGGGGGGANTMCQSIPSYIVYQYCQLIFTTW